MLARVMMIMTTEKNSMATATYHMACDRRRASGTAALPETGAGVRSDSAGRSGLATPVSGPRGSQVPPVLFSSPDDIPATLRGAQRAVRLDSLWAALAPVFSDWTIQ